MRRLAGYIALVIGLASAACGDGDEIPCGPEQPCETGQVCVGTPGEQGGVCAPACGPEDQCPDGLTCQPVTSGECPECRVETKACIE